MAPDIDFESSDILGGALPVGRGRVAQSSGFSSFFKICALGASTLVLLLAFRHGRTFFLRWKERHYKLSMRRRYGIPDHDQRPFNVAYAAARLAQEDKRKIQDRLRNVSTPDQRSPVSHGPTGSGMGEDHSSANQQTLNSVTLQVSGYDRNAIPITKRSPFSAVTATQPSRIHMPSSHADVSGSRLQPRDEESGVHRGEPKQEGDHAVHDSGIDVDSAPVLKRSKRLADASDDSDLRYSQENRQDKRRRKVSARHLKKRMQKGDDVEMDGISDLRMSRGGKKRDRTEMDSSFGADDDILYDDPDTDFALHRHRRRRQRKSSNIFRGQKRGRDVDSLGVDTDSGDLRGRRALRHRPDTSDTDPSSVDDGQLSRDPLCGGRPIGEEWEAHGVQFRVGPDGKRLRRVLVKEDRPKFNMPVDSEHPDRSASVTAIVERWYTEEQHIAAKEAHELAWQDSDKPFAEPETPGDRSRNSSNAGKQLLWASTSNTGSPVRKIRISSHSSIASPRMALISLPPPPQYTRRISSLYTSPAVKSTKMSPKLRPSNSYSKWEKQEIEAEAIARLRRKAEEKEKAKAEAQAREAEAKKVATTPTLPTVLPVKPDDKPSAAPPTATPAFSLPPFSKGTSQNTEPSNAPPLFKIPTPPSNSQPSEAKVKSEGKTPAAAPGTLFSFPSAPGPATQTPAPSNPTLSGFTPASTPAASGTVSSNPTAPSFFTQNSQPTTVPSSAPDAKSSTNSSMFSFGQPKAPSNNPISNVSPAPQGNSSNTTPSFFSFPQLPNPPKPTNNGSNPSASTLPASGTGDESKPKFNFGLTSKPTSVTPPNPPAAPTASDPPSKPVFSFGLPKSSSTPAAPPAVNPFGNAAASSTLATQSNQPLSFGTNGGKFAGAPASGFPSAAPTGEGVNSTNQAKPTTAATGVSTVQFPTTSGGTQAQGETSKPSPFASSNLSTTKPLFSFASAGSDSRSGTKPEPGKNSPVFTFSGNPTNSTPAAVPPTPGSVFSDTAAKGFQNANPIPQPSFGAPKNAAAPGTSGGFSFGQASAPFTFGSFGTQKS